MSDCVCRFCKTKINKETAYKVGDRTYYCNQEHYQAQLNKNKYKPKKTKANGEPNDRRELTDYIQKIYVDNKYDKHFIPWTMIMSQIKNMLQEHTGWTCYTVQYILYYMYEVIQLDMFGEEFNGSILNLVPFYALESEKWYNQTVQVDNSIEDWNLPEAKQVKVNYKKPTKYKEIPLDNIQ